MRCCNVAPPWYLRARPCRYGPPTGPCADEVRPDIWLCVDAIISNTNQTVRESIPLGTQFRFFYDGWCYTTTYKRLDGTDDTATEDAAISSGMRRILCGDTFGPLVPDCNDPLCPSGDGFIEATLCRPAQGQEPVRVFVCASVVSSACVFNYAGACYCIKPGPGVGYNAIPQGAHVFYTNPCGIMPDGSIMRACCQCVDGCVSAPLRGSPGTICCCGTLTLVAYSASWSVRRTQSSGAYQQWAGGATRGTPDENGQLPFRATFTSVNSSGAVVTQFDVDDFLRPPTARCGFPYDNTDPTSFPANWCQYGVCQDDPQFHMPEALRMRYIEPSFAGETNRTGQLVGVSNVSCRSLGSRLRGTVTYTYSDDVETLVADYNANFTWLATVPDECRGACLGATDSKVPVTSKVPGTPIPAQDVIATDNPAMLLP